MPPIFLIGFMCSGKSTLGKALGKATGIEFVDLDLEIEREAGKSVRDIFAQDGEAAFRRLEREILEKAASRRDVIVACGGGTPCVPGAMALMNERGITVRLVPSRDRLITRLMAGKKKRPLLAGLDTKEQMLDFVASKEAEREPYYSLATHTFDSSLLEYSHEIDASVHEFVRRFMTER